MFEKIAAWHKAKVAEGMHKKGNFGMNIVLGIVGLLVATTVLVQLLPGILSNFSNAGIWGTGVSGVLITSVFGIMIVVGVLMMIMRQVGVGNDSGW